MHVDLKCKLLQILLNVHVVLSGIVVIVDQCKDVGSGIKLEYEKTTT